MGDPRHVRPDEVEILVARELRKAGHELAALRVVARRSPDSDDDTTYVAELDGLTVTGGSKRGVLVQFRNQAAVIDADALNDLAGRTAPPPGSDGPKRLQAAPTAPTEETPPPLRVMVTTSSFDASAVRHAQTLGIILLRIADGTAAFLRSQWAMGDQPPAWVPEYMAELVDLGPTGEVRYQLLASGKTKRR